MTIEFLFWGTAEKRKGRGAGATPPLPTHPAVFGLTYTRSLSPPVYPSSPPLPLRRTHPRAQTHRPGPDDKRLGGDGRGEMGQPAPQTVVECGLEILLRAVRGLPKQLFHVRIQGDSRSHGSIMMPHVVACQDAPSNPSGPNGLSSIR